MKIILAALGIAIGVVMLLQVLNHRHIYPTIANAVASVQPCSDVADKLALDRLFPISNYLDVWLSQNYTGEYWNPILQKQQNKLDGLRAWANGIPDRCARDAYLGWINYCQNQLDGAREELRTRSLENEHQRYDKERAAEQNRVRKYSEQVDGAFPNPPKKVE